MEKKKLSFEAALHRLEEILDTLENQECDLDQSLKLYEEGVSLVRTCTERLDQAEQSVKMLKINRDGTAETVDFPGTED